MRHRRLILAGLLAMLAGVTAAQPQTQTNGLRKPHVTTRKPPTVTRTAVCTSYCSKCSGSVTYSGRQLTAGMCAADLRYHKLGTRIRFGPPVNRTLTVEDKGGMVKGRDRFDVAQGIVGKCGCLKFGRRRVAYRVVSN